MAGKYISLCSTRVIHQWRHFQGARLGHRAGCTSIFEDTNPHLAWTTDRGGYLCVSKINPSNPGDTAKLRRLASSHEVVR